MGICGYVQQQNYNVLVDIRYRGTPDVSKMAHFFKSFFANFRLQIYEQPVYKQG